MRKFLAIFLLFVACLYAPLAGTSDVKGANALPVTDFLLSNLQNNQTLSVENGVQGCFGGGTATLEINQRNADLIENTKDVFPTYAMTNEELSAIDKHLYWLHSRGSEGGCTNYQTLKLEIIENGQIVKSTEMSHNWCHFSDNWMSSENRDNVMDFSDLSYRIKQISEPVGNPTE